jgi:membrane-bound lytic murein transglycosylase D
LPLYEADTIGALNGNKLSRAMKNHLNKIFFLAVSSILMVLSCLPAGADPLLEPDTFPVYDSIRPNVSFWKKIYTEYSTAQGVIHDKKNLAIIYEVIRLKDRNLHGSRKINKARIKKVKKKYKQILAKLAEGKTPNGREEQRVAALFGNDAKPADFRKAIRNLRCQVGQNDPFRRGIIRSGAYLAEMKHIFREAGLPEDLVYLPHVESSFNPKAYSKFGAAGMWQFTRSTGKRFMAVSYTVDERRDPIISTRAAARLLKRNYKKLRNWPMAITAYNHGVTGMLRAKRRKGDYETIFKEYRSRIFKFASRNFYSEFLAAREIARDYRQYFGELVLDTPLQTQEVVMAGYGSLPEIARQLNLELALLGDLNPALRKPVLRGQKYVPRGFHLKLPERPDRDWERVIAELAPKIFKTYQKRSRIYTVQRGDTAGEIARMHGIKLRDLVAANNLNSRATIYVNQNLRIPLPDEKPLTLARTKRRKIVERNPAKSQSLPSIEALSLTSPSVDMVLAMNAIAESEEAQEKLATDSSILQAKQKNSEPRSSTAIASIMSYDSEEKNVFQSPLAELAKSEARKEESQALFSSKEDLVEEHPAIALQDQKQLEAKTTISTVAESETEATQLPVQVSEINPEILQGNYAIERTWYDRGKPIGAIRVEVEETLGHYAEWLGITAWEIRRLNGFPYGKAIRIAQKIKIPLHRVSQEEFEEKRFEFHKELAEDFFASFRIEKVQTYTVRRGDNIWTLSKEKFEVPLWLIKKYNAHLDFSALYPSQELIIPVIEKNQV